MAGFEIGAAAIGLGIELVEDCIKCYKVFKTVQKIGEDGALLYTKLTIERVRLENWAESAGVPHNPNPRLRWDVINHVTEQQLHLLRSAGDLTKKYYLAEERTVAEGRRSSNLAVGEANRQDTATALILRASKTIPRHSSLTQKIKWAIGDKTRLEECIANIVGLNDQLWSLVEHENRMVMQNVLSVVLRTSVSDAADASQLDNIRKALPALFPSVEAAAGVKDLRLRLAFEQQGNEVIIERPEPIIARDFKHFNEDKLLKGMKERQGLCLTTYNESVNLVEWRTIETNWDIIQPSLRNLAMLLTQTGDPAFHTLPCAGYSSLESQGRFAFVYDITRFAMGADPASLQHRSLLDLLSENHFISISVRIGIAYDLAEAVLQLHTANWLHKSICSENVRFIAKARAKPREVVTEGEYFLVGYGYARPSTATGALMTELPISAADRDIYRHPSARGEDRQSFQKRFDMYGLACVLVELAFWEPLDNILTRLRSAPAASALPNLGELMSDDEFKSQLSYHVMPAYTNAIKLCLEVPQSSGNDQGMLTSMEANVLRELNACKGSQA